MTIRMIPVFPPLRMTCCMSEVSRWGEAVFRIVMATELPSTITHVIFHEAEFAVLFSSEIVHLAFFLSILSLSIPGVR